MTVRLTGLAALVDGRTRIIILGSMPGVVSLRTNEYYAHPRNRFWAIMEAILGIEAEAPYAERILNLLDAGIGLWDTVAACERLGSLDSSIIKGSESYNDIGAVLQEYPRITCVACNGAMSFKLFSTRIMPTLKPGIALRISAMRLPSTSPANAGYSLDRLMADWSAAFKAMGSNDS